MNTTRLVPLFTLALAAACSSAPEDGPDGADPADSAQPAAATQEALPADANTAVQRLDASPRHGEWVMVPTQSGDSIRAWVVYPERSEPAPVVLVVHEIYGLTNWIRAVADQLAADGFIAIAPDLMTSHDLPTDASGDPVREQATATIRTLDAAVYQQQLTDIGEWGMALPAAADSYGIVGFCWGGSASFQHAVASSSVDAAVVYYGSSPDIGTLGSVEVPVLGLYAGDDERVNSTVPPADSAMTALGKDYTVHMFDGAGHGFLRQQDGREGANATATRQAWPLTLQFFREHLR